MTTHTSHPYAARVDTGTRIADAPWIAPTTAIVAGAIGLAVGLQRHVFTEPSWQTVLVLLAVAPWVIDAYTRRFPRTVWVVVVVASTTALYGGWPQDVDYAPFFLIYLAGTMATMLSTRASVAAAAVAIGPGIVLDVAGDVDGSIIWLLGVTMAWFFGFGFRAQLTLLAQLQEAQSTLAETAAATERQRLAHEIHDLIAHSLSVTMLHITGARMALRDGDPDEALAGLEQAETTGREAMVEIRRTVGLLGPGGSPTAPAAPTAADVTVLVEGFRDAGLDVQPTIAGDLASVPPAPGLAVYRVVQESLTNAAKHATRGPVRVDVDCDDHRVRVVVRNVGSMRQPCSTDGLGIRGMTERVALLGGTLAAGPHGREWVVDATIPL
jgi:signal transduction histidine kinase